MTHKLENNYTKEVLALLQDSRAHNRFPNFGIRQKDENPQGNRLLKGTIKPCTYRTQEKGAVTPEETEPDLPVSVWESPVEVWVNSGLPWGQGRDYNSPGSCSMLG